MAVVLCALLTPVSVSSSRAANPELEFLHGLQQRRLYRLAEIHGNRIWNRDDLGDRERVELAIQLAEVFAQQAFELPADQRGTAWDKADAILAAFLERRPDNPRRLLVEVQQALVLVARGDLERIESDGTRDQQQGLNAARDYVRSAIRLLNDAVDKIGRNIMSAEFTTDELAALHRNLAFQLGRAYRVQALCYPAKSADRDNAFLLAREHLERLVNQSPADSLIWQARLEVLRAYRELGQLDRARISLVDWRKGAVPAQFIPEFAAEHVRQLLAAGDVEAALQVAGQPASNQFATSGPLGLAYLEALIAQWQAQAKPASASDAADANNTANDWPQRITAELGRIRRQRNPYYARRAEVLVGRAFAAAPAGQTIDALTLAAENLFHAGRFDEALAAYDRAAVALAQQGAADRAFESAFTAATVARQTRNWPAASARYRQLALSRPQHPRAAAAHQLAIVCLAEAVRAADPDDAPDRLAAYRALLTEHLEHWPAAESANDARWWSAKLAIGRQQWSDAIDHLEAIEPESEIYGLAVRAAVQCYEALVAETTSDGKPQRRELVARARRFLQPVIIGPDNRWPDQWSDRQLDLAMRLARLHLTPGVEDSEYAQQLLRAAYNGVATSDQHDDHRDAIRASLIHSLIEQGDYPAVARFVAPDSADDPLAAIKALAEQAPDDGDIQETYAALLSQADREDARTEALERWIEVERHSRRGGSRWNRARRARVELLRRLGRTAEADKLARLTRLLYPHGN